MSVAASRPRSAERERTLTDRFLAVFPLVSVFLWLCVVYGVEAWRHGTPWLFGDELEFSQLSRAIAATGHAARRGQSHSFDSLYTYFIAPAWRIHNMRHAYSAAKDLGIVAMTATIFPAYGLGRLVVGRRAALFAAAASVLIPALMYTSLLVEENLAYPYSTLCLFLIVGALLRRTRWWIGGAVLASLLAPAVRGELIVLPAIFLLAAVLLGWRSERAARARRAWGAWDWVGFVTLLVGAILLVSAVFGHHWYPWLIATGYYKHRMFTLGLRAAGALTIGMGVLPVVAGLAALWRVPGEEFRLELRVFRCVLLAALIGFGLYTAVKVAYVSTVFSTLTIERNLIYLAPLLFVGTALWLERRQVHPLALLLAGLAALYLVLTTPYQMQVRLYSDAPGFSILQWANRSMIGLTPQQAKVLLLIILALSVLVLLTPRLVPRLSLALAVVAGTFVLAWNGAGELAAASASNTLSRQLLAGFRGSPTWVDSVTNGVPTLYLGQQIADPNGENVLEFWNRSIKQVWSLDGTAPGPGPTLTPDVHAADGVLSPDPGYPYVVAENGIEVAGRVVRTHVHSAGGGTVAWTLYRVAHPLRLLAAVSGLYPDGWSGPNDSSYTRYGTVGGRAGKMIITVSREQWGGPDKAGHVAIYIGTLIIGPDHQPHIGRVTKIVKWTVHSHTEGTFVLRAPGPRFRVEVHIDPKFRPRDLSPSTTSDPRLLGAVIGYRFSGSQRRGR